MSNYLKVKYGSLFNCNIPKVQDEMHLQRKAVIKYFSQFMAMLRFQAFQAHEIGDKDLKKYLNGIEFSMFKTGVPQLKMEN